MDSFAFAEVVLAVGFWVLVAETLAHLLFVPAGMEHRFEDLSEDFGTWVVFYGPAGGERDSPFASGD